MSADIYKYRDDVLNVLSRLTSIEDRLQAEADAAGNVMLEAIHEHGAGCLREARNVIERLGRE